MTRMPPTAGFNLVELLVSTAIGTFIMLAAVIAATDHSRILSKTRSHIDMQDSGRVSLDLLAADLRMAGFGIGYRPDGSFAGLARGAFTVAGGASFVAQDRSLSLSLGAIPTDDLGIRRGAGEVRTVASYTDGLAQLCSGSQARPGDVLVLRSRTGASARSARVDSVTPATCQGAQCLGGCEDVSFSSDATYASDPYAANMDYTSGEATLGFSEIVWFVVPGEDGLGELRRAEVTAVNPCIAADSSCGGTVAPSVQTLQVAVWQWDEPTTSWVDVTSDAQITGARRIRVDVELVLRSHYVDDRSPYRESLPLELGSGACVPSPCGSHPDQVERRILRTSVELRNSGRLNLN